MSAETRQIAGSMHMTLGRAVHPSAVTLVAIALVAVLAAPVRGQVADNKSYTVVVTDSVFAGDEDAQITLTITNTSLNQQLGSADVTVPTPFDVEQCEIVGTGARDPSPRCDVVDPDSTAASATAVLELRDLALLPGDPTGEFVDVDLTVDVQTCTDPASDVVFEPEAKQSNSFNGEGNDFFLDADLSDLTVDIDGPCTLTFAAQPGNATNGETITAEDYVPDGDPITVEIRDASDDPRAATHSVASVNLASVDANGAPVTLGGTTSARAVEGVAEFSPGPTLSLSAFDYALRATATFGSDDAVADSDLFDIVDDQARCERDELCTVAVRGSTRTATATFDEVVDGVSLIASVSAADQPGGQDGIQCDGVTPGGEVAQYFFVDDDGFVGDEVAENFVGTLTLEIADAAQPVRAYGVCWAALYPFATDGGAVLEEPSDLSKPGTGEPLYVGVLPDCAKRGAIDRPCVSDRTFDKKTSTAAIVIQADGRDPWARS